jgi:hypothetical protein
MTTARWPGGQHTLRLLACSLTAAALAGFAGCDEGRRVIDSQRILGKWRLEGGWNTLEFFRDGTLREERINTGKGTYKLLDGNRIQMEIEGVLWGTNNVVFEYELSGNRLTLTPQGGGVALTMRYTRLE